jgi:type II secretory pathway component PulJ
MPASMSRAMPDDLARLYVLEATIEILKRRLAAAETIRITSNGKCHEHSKIVVSRSSYTQSSLCYV